MRYSVEVRLGIDYGFDRVDWLTLPKSHHLGYRILRRDSDQQMYVIRQSMVFLNRALFLPGPIMKDFSQIPSELLVKRPVTTLWDKHNMIFTRPSGVT